MCSFEARVESCRFILSVVSFIARCFVASLLVMVATEPLRWMPVFS